LMWHANVSGGRMICIRIWFNQPPDDHIPSSGFVGFVGARCLPRIETGCECWD
jgi:hypothetical protein